MKKLIILGLVLLIVVTFATAALAKADLQELVPFPLNDPIDPDASGKAIVNNSEGDAALEITVSAMGLEGGEEYTVWIGHYGEWYYLGEFTANKNGRGHFHRIIRADEEVIPLVKDRIKIRFKTTNLTMLIDEGY